jgi:formylglycine-generating enzyme required for sulfatase activity
VALPYGRYLVDVEGGARFACRLGRGETLALDPPTLPPLPSGTVYVHTGRVFDRQGRQLREVGAFALQDREVTCGDWLQFLNATATRRHIVERYQKDGEWIFVPREGISQSIVPLWPQRGAAGRSAVGTFMLEQLDGTPIDPKQPVTNISYDDALAYAAWLAERDHRPWRLPTRWEWMLAAQGGDGRAFPWGCRGDLGLCHSFPAGQRLAAKAPLNGVSFPSDCTVQGAYDMAGSLIEFVTDATSSPELGAGMGGCRSDREMDRFTTWTRREVMRRMAPAGFGIRLALDVN